MSLCNSLAYAQQQGSQNKLRVALVVDSTISSKYVYDLAQWGQRQDNLEICHLLVQNKPSVRSTFGLSHSVARTAFSALIKLESVLLSGNSRCANHLRDFDLVECVHNTLSIEARISKSGFVYGYDSCDIGRIVGLNLDLLIGCASAIAYDVLSRCARLGIISLYHADNRFIRGGPPGFWEVFLKHDSTGFVIQRMTERADNASTLYRGHFATQRLFLANQAALYEKSTFYLKQLLSRVAITRELPQPLESFPYYNPPYKIPTLRIQFRYIMFLGRGLFKRALKNLVSKRSPKWGVAFSHTNWKELVMWRGIRINNPRNHFLADPFVVEHMGNTYCFVEDYDYATSKGCISVYQLFETCADRIGTALLEPFHMSFPYIFEHESRFYMCPETCENREIRVYECNSFPLQWSLKKILIRDIYAVDTVIFKKDGTWWLFTNIDPLSIGDPPSQLCIYHSDDPLTDKWVPHSNNPILVDSKNARNGGILFDGECVFRVAQRHGFAFYGKSITIKRIVTLTKTRYVEEDVGEIEANFFDGLKGTHHIHSSGRCTVFDFVGTTKWGF